MLTDAALNARERVRPPSEPACFAHLADALPLRMIAVLQASCRIAADRLDVRIRIGGVYSTFIGWWNGERGKAPLLCRPHCSAISLEIAEATAMPPSPDRQFGRGDVFQPKPLQELCRGRRQPGLIKRRGLGLLFRLMWLHRWV